MRTIAYLCLDEFDQLVFFHVGQELEVLGHTLPVLETGRRALKCRKDPQFAGLGVGDAAPAGRRRGAPLQGEVLQGQSPVGS